jgi:hypothetical protein
VDDPGLGPSGVWSVEVFVVRSFGPSGVGVTVEVRLRTSLPPENGRRRMFDMGSTLSVASL